MRISYAVFHRDLHGLTPSFPTRRASDRHLAAWAVAKLASVGCSRDIAGSAGAVTIPASGSLVTHRGRRSRAPERCAMPNSSFKPNPLRGSPASDAPGLSLASEATHGGSA